MILTVDQIRANVKKLCMLRDRVHETVKLRVHSPSKRKAWETACAEYHESFAECFFPAGEAGWSAFLDNDSEGFELALLFLEVDQFTFRSGYQKQIIWDRLKKLYLSPEEHQRIEGIALRYLRKRVEPEFWHMANFMRLRASPSFWQNIAGIAMNEKHNVKMKARWMLLVRQNFPVRRWINSEILRARYQAGYIPRLDFQWPPS